MMIAASTLIDTEYRAPYYSHSAGRREATWNDENGSDLDLDRNLVRRRPRLGESRRE